MKKLLTLLALISVSLTARAAEPTLKMGVVQISKIIKAHWKYSTVEERVKQKEKDIQESFKKLQGEGRALLKSIKEAEDTLKSPLLNDLAKEAKTKEIGEMRAEVKKKGQELQRVELMLRRVGAAEMSDFINDIKDEVNAYGKKNGYSIIQDASETSARMNSVVYYDSALDITDALIKFINAGKIPAEKDATETKPETP